MIVQCPHGSAAPSNRNCATPIERRPFRPNLPTIKRFEPLQLYPLLSRTILRRTGSAPAGCAI
jgi:hypothetical protein